MRREENRRSRSGVLPFLALAFVVSLTSSSLSVRAAPVAHWHPLVALRVHRPASQDYKAYLEWRGPDQSHYDYTEGEFDLSDGWQQITTSYRLNDWVAAWVNDTLVQHNGVSHNETYGSIIEMGKASATIYWKQFRIMSQTRYGHTKWICDAIATGV